jgi:hypothetical protein
MISKEHKIPKDIEAAIVTALNSYIENRDDDEGHVVAAVELIETYRQLFGGGQLVTPLPTTKFNQLVKSVNGVVKDKDLQKLVFAKEV